MTAMTAQVQCMLMGMVAFRDLQTLATHYLGSVAAGRACAAASFRCSHSGPRASSSAQQLEWRCPGPQKARVKINRLAEAQEVLLEPCCTD